MIEANNCPVTLEEFKKHLRNPPEMLDEVLQEALITAATDVESTTLINFQEDYQGADIPAPLKYAILLKAAYLIEHPTDTVSQLTTCSQNLIAPYVRWDRTK